MLVELHTKDKIVGIKQLRKALAEGRARKVFVAGDAAPQAYRTHFEGVF